MQFLATPVHALAVKDGSWWVILGHLFALGPRLQIFLSKLFFQHRALSVFFVFFQR